MKSRTAVQLDLLVYHEHGEVSPSFSVLAPVICMRFGWHHNANVHLETQGLYSIGKYCHVVIGSLIYMYGGKTE